MKVVLSGCRAQTSHPRRRSAGERYIQRNIKSQGLDACNRTVGPSATLLQSIATATSLLCGATRRACNVSL